MTTESLTMPIDKSEMKIRSLEWRDFQDLVEAFDSYRDEVAANPSVGIFLMYPKPTPASRLAWFSSLYLGVLEGDSVAYVVECDGKAVGMCQADRRAPQQEQRHIGDLGINIRKEYRDSGVGTALISKVIEKCMGKFEIIQLVVWSNNERAKHIYSKLGFKTTGHTSKAVKRGSTYFDEDQMSLNMAELRQLT